MGAGMALFVFGAAWIAAADGEVRFDKEPLVIETADGQRQTLTVELALDSAQRQQGLMYRRDMPSDAGMLFDFGQPRQITMWMKNTLIPLDMLFIDAKGRITHVHENAEPLSEAIISSNGPVNFVLELNGGAVKKRNIRPGDRVISKQIGNES